MDQRRGPSGGVLHMEVVETSKPSTSHSDVYVYCGEDEVVRQPGTIQFGPTGVQIYNRKNFPMYELIEFTMELSSDKPEDAIRCTGIVANTEFDSVSGLYRIWMQFLDLPTSACERVHAITRTSKDLCPFCKNY